MYSLIRKHLDRSTTTILSNESLSALWQEYAQNIPKNMNSISGIELRKDDHSICELSQLIKIKFGDHVLCSVYDLHDYERDYYHKHPIIQKEQIRSIKYDHTRDYRIELLFRSDDQEWMISNLIPNQLKIIFPHRTETIHLHDDLPCGFPITYVYNYQTYLIRIRTPYYENPFINVTNDIMSSITNYIDSFCSHYDIPNLLTRRTTETVYTDDKRLEFIDYITCTVNGTNYDFKHVTYEFRDGFMSSRHKNTDREIINTLDALIHDIELNKMVGVKDSFKVTYSIPNYEIAFTFNVDKFLNDLNITGILTKRAK